MDGKNDVTPAKLMFYSLTRVNVMEFFNLLIKPFL
jgi:hypothetical protein